MVLSKLSIFWTIFEAIFDSFGSKTRLLKSFCNTYNSILYIPKSKKRLVNSILLPFIPIILPFNYVILHYLSIKRKAKLNTLSFILIILPFISFRKVLKWFLYLYLRFLFWDFSGRKYEINDVCFNKTNYLFID